MAQYVNQSETVTHGINAPVVNYGQIQVSKNLLDRMPVPDTDVGGKWTSGIPGAVSSFGSGVISGLQANAKRKDLEDKETKTAAENEYARKVREVTARHSQQGGSIVSYENEIRTLGDQYLPLIGADRVAEIASKHSSGYLNLAEQGRKTTQNNLINNYNQQVSDWRAKHPEASNWTDEEIGTYLLNNKTRATAAMDYNNTYRITGLDSYKQQAIKELTDNIAPQLAERIKGVDSRSVTKELLQAYRRDFEEQAYIAGFTPDVTTAALDNVFNSSWANSYAEGNYDWDKLTKEQRDLDVDIKINGFKRDILYGDPVNAKTYSVLGPSAYGEIYKTFMQEDPDASTAVKNSMVSSLNELTGTMQVGTIEKLSNNPRIVGILVKAVNNKTSNGAGVQNTYDGAVVENTMNIVANTVKDADYSKPQEAQVVFKNLSSIDIERIRDRANKAIKSESPAEADWGRRMIILTEANEAGRIAAQLSLPTYNASAKGFERLMGTSAKERLRLDPNTGEIFLAKPHTAFQRGAQFFDNFTGLYETYLSDTNNFIKSKTDNIDIKKQIANLLKIKEETIEDAEAYMGEPLPEIDTTGLYRDGEEGSVNYGYTGMGINTQRASESTGEATGPDFSGIKNVINRFGGSGVVRSQQPVAGEELDDYRGNIDLSNRPVYTNEDGTISTELSMFFEEDGKEILIPTIRTENGKRIDMSPEEAIDWYHKTGEHLGKYDSVEEAKKASEKIHNRPLTSKATVSNSSTIAGAYIDYSEPKQSLKFSDINWSPEMEMYSEIMENIESAGKADAVSSKGARGLMQLMPATYKEVAKRWNLPADGIDNPELNKIAGTLYLQEMLQKYNGDIEKAVAAYNWGPTALDKNIKKYAGNWRRHLPEETRKHIAKFLDKLYNGAW